jgi:hypothetical protein
MQKNTLLEKIKENGFQDTFMVRTLLTKMITKYPDEEVPRNAKRGAYDVPLVDGELSTDDSTYVYVNVAAPNGSPDYKRIQRNVTYTPNKTFFDVLKVTSVGDCRLHAESVRGNGARMQISMDSADAVVTKLVNGYIAGFWRFRKHGRQFYVDYLGESL